MSDIKQIQAETSDSMRQDFFEFSQNFSSDTKKALMVFYDYVVNQIVIPYKIKNKEWEVIVASSNAFVLKLIFHNVIIEDGRHPREILMTAVHGEKADDTSTGGYRIRFINGLITEGIIKDSSFTFDDITVQLNLWNYNYSAYALSADTDKVPWRLLLEPMQAFMAKWKIMGEEVLGEEEIENAILIEFLTRLLEIYLDKDTSIGYGKSTFNCNRELLKELPVTMRMLRAGRRLFELCEWQDLAEGVEHFDEDRHSFLAAFVMKITGREGRMMYDYMERLLDRCSSIYPKNPVIESLQSDQYNFVKVAMDSLFNQNGYSGIYPNYSCNENPKFIETNFVYQRKYTYVNAKQKTHIVSFIESYADGGILIYAIHGRMISRTLKEKASLNQAVHCYFTDDGRRSAQITDSLFITPEMDIEDLKSDIISFFERCILSN